MLLLLQYKFAISDGYVLAVGSSVFVLLLLLAVCAFARTLPAFMVGCALRDTSGVDVDVGADEKRR